MNSHIARGRWDSERSSVLYAFALIASNTIFSPALWAYQGSQASKTGLG
jgi:hypothetical protein